MRTLRNWTKNFRKKLAGHFSPPEVLRLGHPISASPLVLVPPYEAHSKPTRSYDNDMKGIAS